MFTDKLATCSALKERELRMPVPTTCNDGRGTPALQMRFSKKILIMKQPNRNLSCQRLLMLLVVECGKNSFVFQEKKTEGKMNLVLKLLARLHVCGLPLSASVSLPLVSLSRTHWAAFLPEQLRPQTPWLMEEGDLHYSDDLALGLDTGANRASWYGYFRIFSV